jgi:hypothetical protein
MIMIHYYYWSIIIHDKITVLIGIWSDHLRKQCYHKGGMGRPWLINLES